MTPETMPPAAAEAFADYLAMGKGRSLRGLIRLYKERGPDEPQPPTRRHDTLGQWSSRFGWQDTIALITQEEAIAGRLVAFEEIAAGTTKAVAKLIDLLEATRTIMSPTGEVVEVPDRKLQLAAAESLLDRAGIVATKRSALEITGGDGGPVKVAHLHVDITAMSSDELLDHLKRQALGQL